MKALQRQEGGDHYSSQAVQPITYILGNNMPFCEGSVVKYVTRHRLENGAEDLQKAVHYLQFILEHEYGVTMDVTFGVKGK